MSALVWKEKVCPYCETSFGTYSEDDGDYGEHDCEGVTIEHLKARIAELEALTQWQPIETAPIKPEGDYLGFQCGEVFKMYWNYFRDGWVDCYSEVFSEPSHWMPLPKPPEAL